MGSLQVEDISIIEDQRYANYVDSLAAMNAPPLAPKPHTTLSAVGGSTAGTDVALLQQLEELKEMNRQLTERNMQMQSQVTTVMHERTALTHQVEQLQAHGGGAATSSPQFQDLKSILKKKNEENKMLRAHLIQLGYEPPAT